SQCYRRIPTRCLELRMRPDPCRTVAQITFDVWRSEFHSARIDRRYGVKIMKRKMLILLMATAVSASLALADGAGDPASSRHITLQEAVQLALKHNHDI